MSTAGSAPMPSAIDPTLLVLNAIKDDGANTRADIVGVDRNINSTVNDSAHNILTAQERANYHNNMVEDARFRENRDAMNRANDFALNDNRRNTEFLTSAIERNGVANNNATLTTGTNVLQNMERNANLTHVGLERVNNYLSSAIDRINSGITDTINRNGSDNLSSTERNSGMIRDLVNHQAIEQRNYAFQNHTDQLNAVKETLIAAKDGTINLINAKNDLGRQAAEIAAAGARDLAGFSKDAALSKAEIMRQAAELSAAAGRDAAVLMRDVAASKADVMRQAAENTALTARDVLTSRADIMRQISDSTNLIQIEALKNKDSLARQMSDQLGDIKDKFSVTNSLIREIDSSRLRDNQNDYKIENAILKASLEHRHHHHDRDHHDNRRHNDGHIHNNLYSGHGYTRDHHHGFDRGFPGGGGGFPGGGFGGDRGFSAGFQGGPINSSSQSS